MFAARYAEWRRIAAKNSQTVENDRESSAVRLNRCAETLRPVIASGDCNRLRLAFAAFVDVAPARKAGVL